MGAEAAIAYGLIDKMLEKRAIVAPTAAPPA
jgi:ATP-dependent protease ClpP protease subunit